MNVLECYPFIIRISSDEKYLINTSGNLYSWPDLTLLNTDMFKDVTPHDLCFVCSTSIIVTERLNTTEYAYEYDLAGRQLRNFQVTGACGVAYGQGLIVFGRNQTNCKYRGVVVDYESGGVIREFGKAGHQQGQLNHVKFLAISGDSVYMAECGNARISIFSLQSGLFIKSIDTSKSLLGGFTKCISVDQYGTVYATKCISPLRKSPLFVATIISANGEIIEESSSHPEGIHNYASIFCVLKDKAILFVEGEHIVDGRYKTIVMSSTYNLPIISPDEK